MARLYLVAAQQLFRGRGNSLATLSTCGTPFNLWRGVFGSKAIFQQGLAAQIEDNLNNNF